MSKSHTTPTKATLILATLAILSVVAAFGAGSADAGQWMQVSCVNPSQSAAASQGWTSFDDGGGNGSNNSTSCGPGSPAFAILSSDAAVTVGSNETLQYTPPKGSELDGGELDVVLDADGWGADASGTAVAYTPEYAYNQSNVLFQCVNGSACQNGSDDFSGVLTVPAGRGGNLYLSAGCGGESGSFCEDGGATGAWSLVQLWWANLLLANDSTPAAGAITGPLLNPGARGTQELIFNASDPEGPGIYNITAQIDGQTLYTATPNSNGGQCAPVGESDGALMFDASQPCPQSESVDLPINTTGLADGQHTLKVTVEDAAQNSSVIYDATITTHNAPENTSPPAITTPAQPTIGSTLSADPGEWTAPNGAGATTYAYQWEDCDTQAGNCQAIPGAQNPTYTPAAADVGHRLRVTVTAKNNDGATPATSTTTSTTPAVETPTGTIPPTGTSTSSGAVAGSGPSGIPNGSSASEAAILRLNTPTTITRSFARRAFNVTGQLTNNQSIPIADATLDVLQQTDTNSTLQLIGYTHTTAAGTFNVKIPSGASRLIEVAYRASTSDSSYAATATTHENVEASAQLHVNKHRTSPTGRIIITGKVQGPIPHAGTIIELLVRYRGHWEPIRDPQTNSNGQFKVEYQFQGAVGHFPFRVEIPAGQTNFPYTRGYSNTINIYTR
jgi:hypothetical protein